MREGACIARVKIPTPNSLHLVKALEPDNKHTPPHLRVSCRGAGEVLECEVIVEGCRDPARILTLRNTIDDLLISVRAALDSIE